MKKKNINRLIKVLIVIAVIIAAQLSATLFQMSRYKKHVYDCSDMTEDCKDFFDFVGVRTLVAVGKNRYTGVWHEWLVVQLGPFSVPFESTRLMFLPPTAYEKFVNVSYSNEY